MTLDLGFPDGGRAVAPQCVEENIYNAVVVHFPRSRGVGQVKACGLNVARVDHGATATGGPRRNVWLAG
jgi:hypothetical protein